MWKVQGIVKITSGRWCVGITINTTGFSCPWDSGQVGWIYASIDEMKKEYGDISPANIEKASEILQDETKLYDYYLRGECYGFHLYKNSKEVDSCYGFIGDFEEVKAAIKECLPEDAKYLSDEAQYGEEIGSEELEEADEKCREGQYERKKCSETGKAFYRSTN